MRKRALSLAVLLMSVVLVACSRGAPPATTTAPVASAAPSAPAASAVASPSAAPSALPSTVAAAQPTPLSSSATPSGPLASVNVLYGTLTGAQEFVPITQYQDFFQEYGLDGNVSYAESATGLAAVVSGQADFILGGAVDALQAVISGANIKMISYDQDLNPYGLFVGPGITSVADLKGKRAAIAVRGDTSDISLRMALQGSGLNADTDLTIVPVGNSPARLTALMTGQVDAAVLDQEQYHQQAQAAGLRLLVSLSDQKIPYASGGLIVNGDFASAHPDEVLATMKALVQGARYFDDPANETQVLNYLARDLNATPDSPAVMDAWTSQHGRTQMIYPTSVALDNILAALRQIDPTRYAGVTSDQVLDPSFFETLQSSGFLRPGEGEGAGE